MQTENKNAPSLGGWVIAAAAGLVAFGVLLVVGGFDVFPAMALGAVVALIVGLILGMPWGAAEVAPAPRVRKIVPNPLAVEPATPVAAPVAEAVVTAPAAVVSVPVAAPVAAVAAEPAKAKAAPKPKAAAPVKAAETVKAAAKTTAAKPAAAKPAVDKAADAPKAAKPKAVKAAGPARLKAPRKGKADDLKEIEGIGPALEKLVNEMGFFHFDQIAGWTDADVALIDSEMKTFKGRITRDRWVAQAKIIVTEGLEAFRERAKTNNY
jgi:predicted flap endonuclease-1-like 5' DNA nuclease